MTERTCRHLCAGFPNAINDTDYCQLPVHRIANKICRRQTWSWRSGWYYGAVNRNREQTSGWKKMRWKYLSLSKSWQASGYAGYDMIYATVIETSSSKPASASWACLFFALERAYKRRNQPWLDRTDNEWATSHNSNGKVGDVWW